MDVWRNIVNVLYQWVLKIKTQSFSLFFFLLNSTPDATSLDNYLAYGCLLQMRLEINCVYLQMFSYKLMSKDAVGWEIARAQSV